MAKNEGEIALKLERVTEIGEKLREIINDLNDIAVEIETGKENEETEEEKMVGEIAATKEKKIQTLGEEEK